MDPSTQNEVKENADQTMNDHALQSEERATDLALSNSLILAPRHELLRTEPVLKQRDNAFDSRTCISEVVRWSTHSIQEQTLKQRHS